MSLPFDATHGARDRRALAILAKTIYREARSSGYGESDVMTLASELLGGGGGRGQGAAVGGRDGEADDPPRKRTLGRAVRTGGVVGRAERRATERLTR